MPVQRIVFVPTLSTAAPVHPHQPPVYWFTRDTHPRSSQPDPWRETSQALTTPLAIWYAMDFHDLQSCGNNPCPLTIPTGLLNSKHEE